MCTKVVGAELTADVWRVDDGMIDVVGVTTLVFGLLTCGDDDTLDSMDDTIVVGTETLEDGALLLEGEE